MNQLTLDGLLFYAVWGSLLFALAAVVVGVWDRWARRRRWRSLWAELEARRLHRDPQWRDRKGLDKGRS